jgi:tetratricopeptide (TPR) repeat protein
VGDVQGGDPQGLGDTKGAQESYTKALGLLEVLFRADSSNVETRRDLAEVALALGEIVWGRGDLAAGLDHAHRAREILEQLVASSPQDVDQRLLLHNALDLLGQMSLEGGEVAQSLKFYRADLQNLERAPERERQRPDLRRAISVIYGHMADAQIDAGDLAGALVSHRRSLVIRQELVAGFPDNADYEYLVRSARYYLATLLGRMGQWSEALELYRRNLAESPNSGFNQYRAGQALMHLGRPVDALSHFRRALQYHQQEYQADTASLFNQLTLAMDQSGVCKALSRVGGPDAAGTCGRTAAYVLAIPVEPAHAFARSHLAGIWFELGEAYEDLARRSSTQSERHPHRTAARDMYRRSREIWFDLKARKLLAPIDSSHLRNAARAVERTEAALHVMR